MASATITALTSFMLLGEALFLSASTIRMRYRIAPRIAPATPRTTPPRRSTTSPMIRLASPITTTPVPRLTLLDI